MIKKIAVAEDEECLRDLYEHMLEIKGFKSYLMPDPMGIKDLPKDIKLLISDCQMPPYSFKDTQTEAGIYLPDVPILYVSGNHTMTRELAMQGNYTLDKPFTPSILFDCIDAILKH